MKIICVISFAVFQFQENRTSHAGADCIQMIMIFTDGGTEDPTPLVKKLNTDLKACTSKVDPHHDQLCFLIFILKLHTNGIFKTSMRTKDERRYRRLLKVEITII
ncbi:hypothetical protein HPB48_019314 [Haemaphysalis longicornis]|uniref:VWFA domain-containing protein n=1 Tax=Haemaphysalis longicornis TaxID=44386 RepID=A0A9J6H4J8_HAELO|nr:hypothetical protein HPB48_019314 [Haemaphysalis longicornis]